MSETDSDREEELPQRGRGSGRIRRQPVVSVDSNADNVSDYKKKRTIAGMKAAYKKKIGHIVAWCITAYPEALMMMKI